RPAGDGEGQAVEVVRFLPLRCQGEGAIGCGEDAAPGDLAPTMRLGDGRAARVGAPGVVHVVAELLARLLEGGDGGGGRGPRRLGRLVGEQLPDAPLGARGRAAPLGEAHVSRGSGRETDEHAAALVDPWMTFPPVNA